MSVEDSSTVQEGSLNLKARVWQISWCPVCDAGASGTVQMLQAAGAMVRGRRTGSGSGIQDFSAEKPEPKGLLP
jgi:hypothetical protein